MSSCFKSSMLHFSKKYTPIYNPGGEYFSADQDFFNSYSVYKKRREAFLQKDVANKKQGNKLNDKSSHVVMGRLQEYGSTDLRDSMINSGGVDLSQVSGAKFIEIDNQNGKIEGDKSHLHSVQLKDDKTMKISNVKQEHNKVKNVVKKSKNLNTNKVTNVNDQNKKLNNIAKNTKKELKIIDQKGKSSGQNYAYKNGVKGINLDTNEVRDSKIANSKIQQHTKVVKKLNKSENHDKKKELFANNAGDDLNIKFENYSKKQGLKENFDYVVRGKESSQKKNVTGDKSVQGKHKVKNLSNNSSQIVNNLEVKRNQYDKDKKNSDKMKKIQSHVSSNRKLHDNNDNVLPGQQGNKRKVSNNSDNHKNQSLNSTSAEQNNKKKVSNNFDNYKNQLLNNSSVEKNNKKKVSNNFDNYKNQLLNNSSVEKNNKKKVNNSDNHKNQLLNSTPPEKQNNNGKVSNTGNNKNQLLNENSNSKDAKDMLNNDKFSTLYDDATDDNDELFDVENNYDNDYTIQYID
ncbi:hypothetical protein NLO413_0291 [Candidatus Neoehrlichia lotoris str. RAC413]|uniref:Uncharacterized protein n=2 Tax=Candidatus Neoehrlichia procyonis TaxID=467750 RepID=A0A0F3NLJ6_9RICK|nr:hypothetical protein NLO413_0291 [Candidatus Neoehrlichia lotoris str. RAC413]